MARYRKINDYLVDKMMRDNRRTRDYNNRYDRRNDYRYASDEEYNVYDRAEKEFDYAYDDAKSKYSRDLQKMISRFRNASSKSTTYDEVMRMAEQMNIRFDEIEQEEFMFVYFMLQALFGDIVTEPQKLIAMTKRYIEDDNIYVEPSHRIALELYEVYLPKGKEDFKRY